MCWGRRHSYTRIRSRTVQDYSWIIGLLVLYSTVFLPCFNKRMFFLGDVVSTHNHESGKRMRGLHRPRDRPLALARSGDPGYALVADARDLHLMRHKRGRRLKSKLRCTRRCRCRVRPDAAPHRAGSIFPSLDDVTFGDYVLSGHG